MEKIERMGEDRLVVIDWTGDTAAASILVAASRLLQGSKSKLDDSTRCYKPGGPPDKPPGYRGIGPGALAKVMGRVMSRAGVPADFLPHSARHAGVNYRREQGLSESDDDIMELANMSARTYVAHYMRKIRRSRLDNAD